MQTLTFPSLQGTCRKRCKPTRNPNLRQEPFSPSRSNAGQRDSAAKINRLNNEPKNGQLVTAYHCACGGDVVYEKVRTFNYLYFGLIGKCVENPHWNIPEKRARTAWALTIG